MTTIKRLFNEIRFEMLKVILLEAFLDATILFLALLLLLSIFSIGPLLPLIISIMTFIGETLWRVRHISLAYIEEKNPSVREMLRTAADNQDEESLMAHALFAELIEKMRKVSSGSFLDLKRVGAKIASLFILSSILVSLAFFNVNIQKFENPLAGIGDRFTGLKGLFGGGQPINGTNLSDMDDALYGDPRMAKLGQQQLDVQIQQGLNTIDFTKVSQASPRDQDLKEYPVDVDAKASEAYTAGLEDINDRKTAAEYSQQIK